MSDCLDNFDGDDPVRTCRLDDGSLPGPVVLGHFHRVSYGHIQIVLGYGGGGQSGFGLLCESFGKSTPSAANLGTTFVVRFGAICSMMRSYFCDRLPPKTLTNSKIPQE